MQEEEQVERQRVREREEAEEEEEATASQFSRNNKEWNCNIQMSRKTVADIQLLLGSESHKHVDRLEGMPIPP